MFVPQVSLHMLRVAVTGGIGSGKTTVCKYFEQLHVPVLYADSIAREFSEAKRDIRKAISDLFGPGIYGTDGTLDRLKVASLIFSQKNLQHKLNAIIHPYVSKEIVSQLRRLERDKVPLAIVEAALIYEAGLERLFDYVVVVDAPETIRLQRVALRDRADRREVRARMKAQWRTERKMSKADFVIINDGSRKELNKRVKFLHTLLMSAYHQRHT
jgi:dephospho-CoA kinase